MCIKIFNCNSNARYDSSRPLEEQLRNSEKVVIDYDPKDKDVDMFISEMERMVKSGTSCNVNFDLKMINNSNIKSARAKRQIARLKKDLNVNEAIKLLVNIHSELDKKLESLSIICQKR